MNKAATIRVEDLSRVLRSLDEYLHRISTDGVIEVDQDYYWEVGSEQKYDFEREPTVWTIGSLVDDFEHVERMTSDEYLLDGKIEVDVLSVKYITTVLRAISDDQWDRLTGMG